MIKHSTIIFTSMIGLIVLGSLGIYNLVGTYSGQDSLCLSGIIAGLIVGLLYGKLYGLGTAIPILIASLILCVPLVIVSLVLSHAGQDLVESLAFFSIGFSLLSSYTLGCYWGKHLTSASSKDLVKLSPFSQRHAKKSPVQPSR